ncbi:hypothetical protein GCM10022214_80440 [Actinomadura miaoliensis]|uniref:Uncharacterized protein n=2 Tax=Actinomadura miaoliensis TaxID=430685 RepID=A0ABP7X2G6_9ACTN
MVAAAFSSRADLPVCGTCTAILNDEAAAFIAAEMQTSDQTPEEEQTTLRLRVGQRMLNFLAGRLDPQAHADLLADIDQAEIRKAGAGANAYVTTTLTGAQTLLRAVEDLYADMQAKKVRTTQTGFRAHVVTALAAEINTIITGAADAA